MYKKPAALPGAIRVPFYTTVYRWINIRALKC